MKKHKNKRLLFGGFVAGLLAMFTLPFIATISGCASPHAELAETNSSEDNNLPPPLDEKELKLLSMIGGEATPDNNIKIGNILLDRRKNELSFPATVNMTEGPIECLICTKIGRMHESLLVSDIQPFKLQLALTLFGAENGRRKANNPNIPQGTILDIDVLSENGERVPIEKWLINSKTQKEFEREGWVFVGSSFSSDGKCAADEEGNLVLTWSFGNTILDNPSLFGNDDDSTEIHTSNVPAFGTPVTVFLRKR